LKREYASPPRITSVTDGCALVSRRCEGRKKDFAPRDRINDSGAILLVPGVALAPIILTFRHFLLWLPG
jgi:hypothetical protein